MNSKGSCEEGRPVKTPRCIDGNTPLDERRAVHCRPKDRCSAERRKAAHQGAHQGSHQGAHQGAPVSEVEGTRSAQGEVWKEVRPPSLELAEEQYSIQVPRPQSRLFCPRCDDLFSASGPTGHAAGQPICDLCLLDGSHELGMLLALASAARVFGAFVSEDTEEYRQALADYGAFAKVYELVAARSGPPRLFPSMTSEKGS